jgi:tRNA threonylcarbamoyladenosine biosynthesis protein TsaB
MILALETSLNVCSAALLSNGHVLAEADLAMTAGHAEALLPLVSQLREQTSAHWPPSRLAVGVGPGSFTGVRVATAAAQALALAWRAPVTGVTSLAMLAQGACAQGFRGRLLSVIDARNAEVYAQGFDCGGGSPPEPLTEPAKLSVAVAADLATRQFGVIGGPGADVLLTDAPGLALVEGLTVRARWAAALASAPDWPGLPAIPVYLRAPDAKRPERDPLGRPL